MSIDPETVERMREAGRDLAALAEERIASCSYRGAAHCEVSETCPECGEAQRALRVWAVANWRWSMDLRERGAP